MQEVKDETTEINLASATTEDLWRDYATQNPVPLYNRWVESLGLPIHKGYYFEDLRTLEVAPWEERGCNAAFIQLTGLDVTEVRIAEIPGGKTTRPAKLALDEVMYVVEGQGLTKIWAEGHPARVIEWGKRSLMCIPRNHYAQFTNMRGDKPARLLHYNYLPLGLAMIPDPEYFFNDTYSSHRILDEQQDGFYSEAKVFPGAGATWIGNFFPDLSLWDQLTVQRLRGGGKFVRILYPGSQMASHLAVFPSRTYKKAHRHGAGFVIVVPAGEGYSVMWLEGEEKRVFPWHEGSLISPADRMFHQHFNLGTSDARYLALWPAPLPGVRAEQIADLKGDQIEFPDEDPWLRQNFEAELAKRQLTSDMPEEAYRDPNYQWTKDSS